MTFNYKSIEDVNSFRAKLNSIVECQADDTWITHLRQIFAFQNEEKVVGFVNERSFSVWIHGHNLTGAFHPMVYGYFRSVNDGTEVCLRSKFNPIGSIVFILLASTFLYTVVTGIIIQDTNEVRFLLPRIVISIVIFSLMMSLPTFIYFRTSKIVTKHLITELGLVRK